MSQKVHPKSLRSLYWQPSDGAVYTEGPNLSKVWGKILFYRYYLFSILSSAKLRTIKAPSAMRIKKPKYRFSHMPIRMFGNNIYYSPIYSTFPRQKTLSMKYLPISFQNKRTSIFKRK